VQVIEASSLCARRADGQPGLAKTTRPSRTAQAHDPANGRPLRLTPAVDRADSRIFSVGQEGIECAALS